MTVVTYTKNCGDQSYHFIRESKLDKMLTFFTPHGKLIIPNTTTVKKPRFSVSPLSLVYFKAYFLFTYMFCFSPFLIRYNQTTGSFVIYKSKYHQIVCGVLHSFILFQYLSLFRRIRLETLHLNPDNYFEFANVLGSLVYFLTLFTTLWKKQSEFLSIFKLVGIHFSDGDEELALGKKSHLSQIKKFVLPLFICFVFLGLSVFSTIIGNVATNKWKFLEIPPSYFARANFVYLFRSDNKTVEEILNPSPVLTFVTAWYVFIELYIWIGAHFTDLLFLFSAIFLKLVANEFCNCLNKKDTTSYEGIHHYFTLRKIIHHLNNAVGPIALCIVVTGLPYHASNVELLFSRVEVLRRLRVLLYWIIFVTSLVTAASGNLKIGEMKEWLLKDGNTTGIPQSTLTIVIQELSHTGLRGWGFFTITYRFLGTILSVVLTYSILIVQLHFSGSGAGTIIPPHPAADST